jgi:hypothetical protein
MPTEQGNSKFEIRNPKQHIASERKCSNRGWRGLEYFRFLNFGFVSNFELRISDLGVGRARRKRRG